jgi:nuclear polyadenylated RNA-binding protein 3
MTTAAEPAEASDTIVVGGADQDSHDESMVDEVSSDVYAEGDSASQAQVLDSTGTGVLVPAAASNDPSPSTSMDLDMQTGSFEAPVDVAPAQEAPANATSAAVPKASRDVANAPASSSSSSSSASDSDSDLDEADNDDVAQDHDPAEIASANEALGSAGEPQAARAPSGHDAASEQPNQQDAADAMSDNDSAGSIDSADIQKMVDDMSARAAASSAKQSSTLPAPPAQPFPSPAGASQPASLPPKPSLPAQAAQFAAGNRASPSFDPNSLPAALKALNYPGHPAASISATTPGALPGSGAPGTSSDASLSLPPPPPAQFNGHAPPPFPVMSQHYPANTGTGSADANHGTHQDEQTYEQFIADERRYMAEAKWERFPEGSRIFVGEFSLLL